MTPEEGLPHAASPSGRDVLAVRVYWALAQGATAPRCRNLDGRAAILRRRASDDRVPMSERAQRVLTWIFFVVVFVVYFGGGYYFGVIDRPRRHPLPVEAGRNP